MNNKGLTLIEVIAGIAMTTVVILITMSIFMTGIKQSVDTKKEVNLQQEVNYVATVLRKEYLSVNQYSETVRYTLQVSDSQIVLNGKVVSDQYQHIADIQYDGATYGTNDEVIVKDNSPVMIKITLINGNDRYTLRTTLSRGM